NGVVARFDQEAFGSDGPTAEIEILRGDLARLLHDACPDTVKWRYGDHIAEALQTNTGVSVRFAKGPEKSFDLVIIAEGAGASSRKLVFGDEARIKPWGLDTAYFTIPKGEADGDDARCVQQKPIGWDDLSTQAQKQQLNKAFADAALVKMPHHVKGRVLLMGDAGWAVMGRGTSMALIGPWVLAGELQRCAGLEEALEAFDAVMKPFVEKAQK
ncbi:hypothetical protein LTR94_029320, partial [Friedmanniomyces endolithicus]